MAIRVRQPLAVAMCEVPPGVLDEIGIAYLRQLMPVLRAELNVERLVITVRSRSQ